MSARKYDYENYKYLNGVSGIYVFINLKTNKCYVGRSLNIYKRIGEHLRHSNNCNKRSYNTSFYKALREYEFKTWIVTCIYQCSNKNEMIKMEEHFIKLFNSSIDGYNFTNGIKMPKCRRNEKTVNAKLTNLQVFDIREAYRQHKDPYEIYEKFKEKISFSTFINIWRGYRYPDIHTDVYTSENKEYYRQLGFEKNKQNKYKNDRYKKTRDCVCEIRTLYLDTRISKAEIYEKFNFLNQNTFNDIWYGKTFKEIIPDGYLDLLKNKRKYTKQRSC